MNSLIQKSWDASTHRCIQGKRFLCKRNSDRRLGASTEKRFQPSRRKVAQRNIGFARGRGSSRYTNVHTEGSSVSEPRIGNAPVFPIPPPCIFHLRDHPFVPGQAITRGPFCFVCLENSWIKFCPFVKFIMIKSSSIEFQYVGGIITREIKKS